MHAILIAFVEDLSIEGRLKHYAQAAENAGAMIICADSGGEAAKLWGLKPRLLIGDMDSISPQTLAELSNLPGIEVRYLRAEKDETDLEMALYTAIEMGANEITIVGGLGGRTDHTLGNLYLLAAPRLHEAKVKVRLLGEREEIFLLHGGERLLVEGQAGELLSLFPMAGDASGIWTTNLYYSLKGETLFFGPTRGVSNVFIAPTAEISLESGMLLVVHNFA